MDPPYCLSRECTGVLQAAFLKQGAFTRRTLPDPSQGHHRVTARLAFPGLKSVLRNGRV